MGIFRLLPEVNLKRSLELMEEVTNTHGEVDLVVFPEAVNVGFIEESDHLFFEEYLSKSETLEGPFVSAIANKAQEISSHVILGISRLDNNSPDQLHNSAVLIDDHGKLIGLYDKIHLFKKEKKVYKEGKDAAVFDSKLGKIGMMICYDLSFPEISRVLSLKGAEIICCPFNGRDDKPYKAQRLEYLARTRAYENNLFFIVANRVGYGEMVSFMGHSIITSPSGEIVSQSFSKKEEIIFGLLSESKMISERNENYLLKDRRPEIYNQVINLE